MTSTTNWAGNITFEAESLERPTSVDRLAELVASSGNLRVLGSGHSFNRIADTPSTLVSIAGLPADIHVDSPARSVTVAGGARYGEFVETLDEAGWAIHNLASLPHISVAGAISTGTHGSGDRNGSLATAVSALELVLADGSTVTTRRGDPEFDGMVVSLGALGVITRVTLDLVPAFEVRQDVFEGLSWTDLYEHYDEITASAYSVSLFTQFTDDGIRLAWLKSRTDDSRAGTGQEFFGARKATTEHHPLPDLSAENSTPQLGAPGRWWNRLPHFVLGFTPSNGEELQSEFLVPRRNALAAIDAVRAFGERMQPHLFAAELRTIARDPLWLSPTHTEDCIGIHFTWHQDTDEVGALLTEIGAALAPLEARPHWGKVFDADGVDVDALYPRAGDFRSLASALDPEGKFRNDFVNGLLFR